VNLVKAEIRLEMANKCPSKLALLCGGESGGFAILIKLSMAKAPLSIKRSVGNSEVLLTQINRFKVVAQLSSQFRRW